MKKNIPSLLAAAVIVTGLLSPLGSGGAVAKSAQSRLTAPAETTAALQNRSLVANELKAFTDVEEGNWAAHAVMRWSRSGVISGYGDGSFRPEQQVTRAEFSAIVNRIFGYKDLAAVLPADVPAAAWYKDDIAKAVAAEYLIADADQRIGPAAPLKRGEAVLALQRILRLETERQAKGMYSDLAGADSAVSAAADALRQPVICRVIPEASSSRTGGSPVPSWQSWRIHWWRSCAPQPGSEAGQGEGQCGAEP